MRGFLSAGVTMPTFVTFVSNRRLTTIMDCEDSVAAVDVEDKLTVYGNWLGLMKGDLNRTLVKDGETIKRELLSDLEYTAHDGGRMTLPARSLMLVRNVGSHLETDIVAWRGKPIPETVLDAMVTAAAAKHDLLGNAKFRNSRAGSVYVVKPKMHGPAEVALASELFSRVEDALGLARFTLKMGIMDEERRTSAQSQGVALRPRKNGCSSSIPDSSIVLETKSTP